MIYYLWKVKPMMNFFRFLISKTLALQLLLALLVGILFVYLSLGFLKYITFHDEYQKVPDLRGIPLINLSQIVADKNLRYEIIDSSKFTPNLPPLSVIEHLPGPWRLGKEKSKYLYYTKPFRLPKNQCPRCSSNNS